MTKLTLIIATLLTALSAHAKETTIEKDIKDTKECIKIANKNIYVVGVALSEKEQMFWHTRCQELLSKAPETKTANN